MNSMAAETAIICPTVTEEDPASYNYYAAALASFASRIHLDYADGEFAPRRLAPLAQTKWPEGVLVDVHLMLQGPGSALGEIFSRRPYTVIIHAESAAALNTVKRIKAAGLRAGLAFLPATDVEGFAVALKRCDYALVFGGRLGYQGGEADLSNLSKVAKLRTIKADLEIGWDGGVNVDNAARIIGAGVDVLNVGGFIKNAADPASAYAILETIVQSEKTRPS